MSVLLDSKKKLFLVWGIIKAHLAIDSDAFVPVAVWFCQRARAFFVECRTD